MIRISFRRFYSTPPKPTPKPKTKPFALARPTAKPRPKPTPRTLPKELEERTSWFTFGEIARATFPFLFKRSEQLQRDLRQVEELAEGEQHLAKGQQAEHDDHDRNDWTFQSFLEILRRCVVYSIGIFVFGHLFITHVFDLQGTLGASMLPTLYIQGDWVLVNRLYRRGKGVQVGDLVEAKDPLRADGRVLKRIIGMPGDFVVAHTVDTDGMMLKVPQGHCFLAGDNQPESRDSRLYGPIPLALITGKVSYRVLPPWRIGPLENTLKPVNEKELCGSI